MTIKKLKIFSSNLEEQIDFYFKTLGFKIIDSSANSVRFQAGKSILEIEKSSSSTPYHFTFNIPCNQEDLALDWLSQRVPVLSYDSIKIQDFVSWNAKAIYFYDKDLNIVELIARKNLDNPSQEDFSVDSIIQISEIGAPVSRIEKIYEKLYPPTKIPIYDGGFERFCAIGDEHGLFICINKNIKDWFPTNDKAFSSAFEIDFIEQGSHFSLSFQNEDIEFLEAL